MRHKEYTKEEIIKKLKKYPNLTANEWRKKDLKPSIGTIKRYFGSWNKARKRAGLKMRKVRKAPRDSDTSKEISLENFEKELIHYKNCEKEDCEMCIKIQKKMLRFPEYLVTVQDGWVEEKMDEFLLEIEKGDE